MTEDILAILGWVIDYVEDLRDAIKDSEQTNFTARQYALAHMREIDIQLTYVRLALENK